MLILLLLLIYVVVQYTCIMESLLQENDHLVLQFLENQVLFITLNIYIIHV